MFSLLIGRFPGTNFLRLRFLVGPLGVQSSFPLMVRLIAPFLEIAPLWEISGTSEKEDPSHRGEGPFSFSLLSMWEGAGTRLVPVDSSLVPIFSVGRSFASLSVRWSPVNVSAEVCFSLDG